MAAGPGHADVTHRQSNSPWSYRVRLRALLDSGIYNCTMVLNIGAQLRTVREPPARARARRHTCQERPERQDYTTVTSAYITYMLLFFMFSKVSQFERSIVTSRAGKWR